MQQPIVVIQRLEQSIETVWDALADISTHVVWMRDAQNIEFVGSQRQGVGTEFVCQTAIGPLRTADHMRVTEWEPGKRMSVYHSGSVIGEGTFILTTNENGQSCTLRWEERLKFPWFLGAGIGERIARPLLRAIWVGNLRRLDKYLQGQLQP